MQWLQAASMLQGDPFSKTERGLLTSLTWEISPEKKYKTQKKKTQQYDHWKPALSSISLLQLIFVHRSKRNPLDTS